MFWEFFEFQSFNILKSIFLLILIDSEVGVLSISVTSFSVASEPICLQLSLTLSPNLYEFAGLLEYSSTAAQL